MKRAQTMRFLDSLPTEMAERVPFHQQHQQQFRPQPLDIGLRDDFFVVPEIEKRTVPREDGYQWNERELQNLEEDQPYNHQYRKDLTERLRILESSKDYRFIREIAGAMRRNPIDIIEEDDLTRVLAEENLERRRRERELDLTYTAPDQKKRAIDQLRERSADLLGQINRLEGVSPVSYLSNLSRRLIDDDQIPLSVPDAHAYGFVHLMQYYDEYALLHRLLNLSDGDDVPVLDQQLKRQLRAFVAQVRVRDPLRADRIQAYWSSVDSFESRRRLYVFLLYHRDFLSNQRYDSERISMKSSLLLKLIYVLQPVRNIMQHHPVYRKKGEELQRLRAISIAEGSDLFEANEVELLEAENLEVENPQEEGLGDFDKIASGEDTLLRRERQPEAYVPSQRLRLEEKTELAPLSNDLLKDKRDSAIIFQTLDLPHDVWTELDLLYDDADGEINWNLFRISDTPSINLRFFLDTDIERQMVTADNCKQVYAALSCQAIDNFIFSGNVQRGLIVHNGRLDPYTPYSREHPEGLPPMLIQLIKIQLPDYVVKREPANLSTIADIMKSNLLALYYDKMGVTQSSFAGVIDALRPQKEKLMQQRMDTLGPIIEQMVTLYKFLMLYYFLWILEYFRRVVSTLGLPVWRLPDDILLLIDENVLEQEPEPSDEEEKAASELYRAYKPSFTLDMLNAAFFELDVEDFIQDEIFKAYLHSGQNAFITTLEEKREEAERRAQNRPKRQTVNDYVKHTVEGYPILQLHYIFVAYQRYVGEYSRFLQQRVAETDNAIKLATEKLNTQVGEDRVDGGSRRRDNFVNRKAFAMAPINSGIVQIKAEIKSILNRAYHNVMIYCDGLRDVPLDALQNDSAFDQGLTGEFVEYMTSVYKSNTLRFQENYKTRQEYQQAAIDLAGLMTQLKHWRYRRTGSHYQFYREARPYHSAKSGGGGLQALLQCSGDPNRGVTVLPFQ